MSKLIYLMPVWMGCEDYLIKALQVSMNKVARLVTRLDVFTSTSFLLQQCGWLTVEQLMVYHSTVLLHKTLKQQKPTYLYKKVTSGTEQYNTRQAALVAAGVIEYAGVENCELGVTSSSWSWAFVKWYNRLPADLRAESKLGKFKTRLKEWVTKNIESS